MSKIVDEPAGFLNKLEVGGKRECLTLLCDVYLGKCEQLSIHPNRESMTKQGKSTTKVQLEPMSFTGVIGYGGGGRSYRSRNDSKVDALSKVHSNSSWNSLLNLQAAREVGEFFFW